MKKRTVVLRTLCGCTRRFEHDASSVVHVLLPEKRILGREEFGTRTRTFRYKGEEVESGLRVYDEEV